jgi:hypothetical protein
MPPAPPAPLTPSLLFDPSQAATERIDAIIHEDLTVFMNVYSLMCEQCRLQWLDSRSVRVAPVRESCRVCNFIDVRDSLIVNSRVQLFGPKPKQLHN